MQKSADQAIISILPLNQATIISILPPNQAFQRQAPYHQTPPYILGMSTNWPIKHCPTLVTYNRIQIRQ